MSLFPTIIPNSSFISSTVVNKGPALGYTPLDVAVVVKGCSSATAARDLLTERLATCSAIQQHPKPRVYLLALGEGQWSFRLLMQSQDGQTEPEAINDLLLHLSRDTPEGVSFATS